VSATITRLLGASIIKKQIVAITGLGLAGFVVFHLSGNLLIFLGPEAFNGYAEKFEKLGELKWLPRAGLILFAFLHVYFTILVVLENREARGSRYAVRNDFGSTSWAKKTMIYSGLLVFFFLFIHIGDFTLPEKTGPTTVVPGVADGESLGLYGLVWNSYLVWWRSLFYVIAVCCVGMHLSHGIQSVFQTMGINHPVYTPLIKRTSIAIGAVVAVGFASIPLFVLIVRTPPV